MFFAPDANHALAAIDRHLFSSDYRQAGQMGCETDWGRTSRGCAVQPDCHGLPDGRGQNQELEEHAPRRPKRPVRSRMGSDD